MIAPRSTSLRCRRPVAARSTDDDGRRHHARQPAAGRSGTARDQVVLAEHVVELDPGAGHDDAEPEPVEEDSDAALPSASTTETCVVPPAGRARARRAVPPRSWRPPRPAIRRTATAAADRHDAGRSRTRPRAHASARASPPRVQQATRPCRARHGHPLEKGQAVGDQDAAGRRRRVRHDLVVAVAHRGRADATRRGSRRDPRSSACRRRRRPWRRSQQRARRDRSRRRRRGRCARACPRDRAVAARRRAAAVRRRPGCRAACPRQRGAGSDRGSHAGAPAAVSARLRRGRARSRAGAARPTEASRRRRAPPRARQRRPAPRRRLPRSERPASSRVSPPKPTSTACICAPTGAGRPSPGVATKKSARRAGRPSAGSTSANPPAPGPVSGLSVTQAANAAPTHASTAFPPSSRIRAPAWAVRRCPAAIAPFMNQLISADG